MKKPIADKNIEESKDRQPSPASLSAALLWPKPKVLYLHNSILRYAFALAMVAAALLFRYALAPLAQTGLQFVTVFPVLMIVAIFAGRWPAVLYSLIAGPLAVHYFSAEYDLGALASAVLVVLTALVAGRLTERLHAALDKSRTDADALARQAQLLNISSDAIFSKDNENRIIFWNRGAEKLYGYTEEEAAGKEATQLLRTQFPEPTSSVRKDLEEHGAWEGELIHTRKDGGSVTVLSRWAAERDSNGRIVRILESNTDITDRKRAEDALRETEERFRTMANSIPQLAWIAWPDGFIYWYNQRWYEYTGKTPQEMEGWGWQSVHDPEVLPKVLEKWKRSIATGQPFDMEFPLKGADNVFRPFLTRVMPLKDENGHVMQWFGTNTDLSERKRAEQELALSQERFESFMRHLPGAAFIKDLTGKYVYANPELTRIFERTMEEMLGKTDADLLPPETASHFQENDSRALQQGSIETVERLRQPDGLEHHSIVSKFIVPGPDSKPVYIGGVVFDITERIKAEDALRESESRFRGAFENAAVGMTQVDLNGNWMAVNQRFCNMTGYSKEALIGTDFMILTHPDDIEADRHLFAQLIHGEVESYFVTKRYIRRDGTVIWTDLYRALQRDTNNKPVYTISIVVDITDRKHAEQALASSELFYRQTLESIPGMVFTTRPDGYCDYQSSQWVEFTGVPMDQMLGDGWNKLLHPDDQPHAIAAWREAVQERAPYNLEYRVRRYDGVYEWFKVRGAPIRDNKGKIVRWFGVATNITDLKDAQEALHRGETRLRLAASAAQLGVFEWDVQTDTPVWENERMYEIFGRSPEQGPLSEAEFVASVIDPRDVESFKRAIEEGFAAHGEFRTICRIRRQNDGAARWIEYLGRFEKGAPGGSPHLIGVIADITERKKAEEALLESMHTAEIRRKQVEEREQILTAMMEHIPLGITIADAPDVTIRAVSRYGQELTGKPREQIEGIPADLHSQRWQIYHSDGVTPARNDELPLTRATQKGELVIGEEWAILRSDGQLIPILCTAAPIRDVAGTITGGVIGWQDISGRKQSENELLMYKEKIEQKNKEMESILGIVSHDLRAPLVNIQGFSHEVKMDCETVDTLLAETPVEQTVEKQLDKLLHKNIPESLQYILTSTEAMNKLVVLLVEVARAGLAPTKPEVIDMDELIYKILESIKIKFKEADVTYDVTAMPDCFADRTQVTQIFTNLLDNAVKYLDPSRPGWICIEGMPQADGVLYWISDNGIGIPPEEQEKIFEPYYQLKEKASGGIGMGLATVKKLVDRNNGKIWVVAEKGKYSIFYVALPRK